MSYYVIINATVRQNLITLKDADHLQDLFQWLQLPQDQKVFYQAFLQQTAEWK